MSATATAIRPGQALRQRRESQRPGIARVNTRATTVDAADSTPALPVPLIRTPEYILRKFNGKRPSLILHLHPTHFRFDQQDGSFTYTSPMRVILEHLKDGTVPHIIIEELLAADVPWYDGCLIVEVHDHKTGVKNTPANATNQVGGTSNIPFSVNNYNEHITPSAFAPFPADKLVLKPAGAKATPGGDATNGVKETDKENMPAPEQPASATQKKQIRGPRIFTTVLFPTALSFEEEKNILARTPITDARGVKRILQANSRDGITPTAGQPPTPLASVPSTPLVTKSTPRKPKMALDETNVLEFEAEVLRITNPKLYLEPAKNPEEGFAILRTLAHPLHSHEPSGQRTRKRTVAELAADEAQAASDERFVLSLDERHQQSGAAAAVAASDGQAGVASFEPTFKRFKTLENIKIKHAELEREKKEAAAREAHMKRQQSEADALKKQELERRQAEQKMAQDQARVDLLKQQQMHQRALAAQQAQAQAQAQTQTPMNARSQQLGMMPTPTHPQLQQGQHAPHMSPIQRQASQTPMTSSPMIGGPAMSSMPMTSITMSATASTQGAGSPARPPTSMSAHPNSAGMTRQVSQQHQVGSGHGTPQMLNTPNIGSAVPVSRNMTPQPRGVTQHGSPMSGVQGTPMMGTPSHTSQLTTEQQQHVAMMQAHQLRLQQQRQQAIRNNAAAMQASPQNMQQMMAMQQRQQQQAMLQQMQMQQQQQQNGMQQGSPNNNMMTTPNPMQAQPNMQRSQALAAWQQRVQAERQKLINTYQQQKQQRQQKLINDYGGNPEAITPQARAQFQMMEHQKYQEFNQFLSNFTRDQMMKLQQQDPQQAAMMMRQQSAMNQQQQGGGPAPGIGAGMMQNMAQMGGNMMGGAANAGAMAQYQQLANEQRQRMEQQQRAQQGQNMMGPGQGIQNMQGMQGMNMAGMNAQQMQQAMQQNPQLMNQFRLQQMQQMQQQMGQQMGMPGQGM